MKARTVLSTLLLGAAGWALARQASSARYRLAGRVVAITGGSRGFGLALAREYARAGAHLALLARDRAELERARAGLERLGAASVLTLPCDVRVESQVQAAIAEIAAAFGRLDLLVNNAGVITVGPLETMTTRDFDESMALHFWAPLYATLAAWPHLRQAPGGARLINIASFGGKVAVPHMAPYCASKFALVGLSDALRAELARDGIRVTTVCPGLMRTGSHVNAFFKGAHEEEFAWFAGGMAVPGGAMAARRAARSVIAASIAGRAELILTLPAKAAVLVQALAPGLLAGIIRLMNRLLPRSSGSPERRTGWQSRRKIPGFLLRRADRATVEFNGLRGHAVPKHV